MKTVVGKWIALGALVLSVAACSTVRAPSDKDPFEGMNRGVDAFNQALDKTLVKPATKGYQAITPDFIEQMVANFFANLGDIANAFNNFLQGKGEEGFSDVGRVTINTTFGLFGLFDIASEAGLPKHDEDFGQTLAVWGVDSGPYLVLPLLGPSTVRDGLARIVDSQAELVNANLEPRERNVLIALRILDARRRLLPTTDLVERIALDQYAFVRDAYLARRQSLIRDGKPEPEENVSQLTPVIQSGSGIEITSSSPVVAMEYGKN